MGIPRRAFEDDDAVTFVESELPTVGRHVVMKMRRIDMIDAMIVLSEGGTIPPEREAALIASGPTFIRDAKLGFVIVDRGRASRPLIDFAQRALRLRLVEVDGLFDLYQPSP